MGDLISVIVPIYRVEPYLAQCIQSICDQTYKDLEIILVDDGSDDRCPHICDMYATIDTRIKVIHKKNGGPDSARKEGMLLASGKYIGYVDGDDWIEPEMYEELLKFAQTNDVDVVESGVIDTWGDHTKERVAYLDEGCYKDEMFIKNIESKLLYTGTFFSHGISPYMWSKLFLRDKIFKYQMIEGKTNELHDDIMVSLPCIAETRKLYISHNCYYHYRVRENSMKRKYRKNGVHDLFCCYPEFYKRFEGTRLCCKDDKQIQYYIMYWLLFKVPHAFDDTDTGFFLEQFGRIRISDKIVLYGAGAAGIHLEKYIRSIKGSNIVCWADKNYKELQNISDIKAPKELVGKDYDHVIISILREEAVNSARKDLMSLGIAMEKIIWISQKYIDDPELLLRKVTYRGKRLICDNE